MASDLIALEHHFYLSSGLFHVCCKEHIPCSMPKLLSPQFENMRHAAGSLFPKETSLTVSSRLFLSWTTHSTISRSFSLL